MKKATLKEDLAWLLKDKRRNIEAIRQVECLISELLPLNGHSLFEQTQDIGDKLPSCLRNMGSSRIPDGSVSSVDAYLRAQLFLAVIAEMEALFSDVMFHILIAFPQKIAKASAESTRIANAEARREIIEAMAQEDIVKTMYASPGDYRIRIEELISARDALKPNWGSFIEAKATRDVGLHNGWKKNRVYQKKAGDLERSTGDDNYLFPSVSYFAEVLSICTKIIDVIENSCMLTFKHCIKTRVFKEMWEKTVLHKFSLETYWSLKTTKTGEELFRTKITELPFSGTERLMFDFFCYIYHGDPRPDFGRIYERHSGDTLAVVDNWLNYPFYF